MTQEEHNTDVGKLTELEIKLQTAILDVNDYELSQLFIEWQEQRNVCNEGFHKILKTMIEESTKQ